MTQEEMTETEGRTARCGFFSFRASDFGIRASALAALVFLAIAPTLTWPQFSGGSENLVVGTVLEMKRGGPWVVPTLKGAPRTTKPPLTTWACAALVSDQTVRELSDVQAPWRERAYAKLAWQVRWPALLSGCLLLIATAWLGRILSGDAVGLASAVVAASTFLFLRFNRSITTDVHLALWVVTTNALWVGSMRAPAGRQRTKWTLSLLGGVSLALALMTKGPVALAQTVLPLAIYWVLRRPRTINWGRVLLTVLVVLLLALPWPVYVLTRLSGQLELWVRDATRVGATALPADPVWAYLPMLWMLVPWVGFFVLGVVRAVQKRRGDDGGLLALLLCAVPVAVMTFFPDKNERYLLPMLAPAAILAARAFLHREETAERGADAGWRLAMGFTWLVLGVLALGFPLAGPFLRTQAGAPWWPLWVGGILAFAGAVVVISCWRWDRVRELGALPASLLVMLLTQALFLHGYARSPGGLSDMKPLADAIAHQIPAHAEVWGFSEPGRFSKVPIDLPIYLNRTVRQATDPTTLPSGSSVRQVMLVFRGKEEASPLPPFRDWQLIGSAKRKNQGFWEAYARPE
ncbi:MAG TPA: phospholipid carrier-dependent glycosyltransferase [Tepidisphaeraceae bacterium]